MRDVTYNSLQILMYKVISIINNINDDNYYSICNFCMDRNGFLDNKLVERKSFIWNCPNDVYLALFQ